MTTLIIPCAGKSSRYPNIKPKWLFTHPDGKSMLEKSVSPFLNNKKIKNKIITITKNIEKKFQVKFLVKQMFGQAKFSYALEKVLNPFFGKSECFYL